MTAVQQKRYFEFQDDKSAKFWEVTIDGTTVTVRYGKIGTNGQSQTKELADAVAAAKHVSKLVAEKTAKGYVESGDSAEAQAASETDSGLPPTAAPRKKAATAKKAVVTNPAKDPEASPESLLALLNQDDTTNRLLARHPRASADLLEKLSHSSDKATRQGVAAHPNTPPETYVKLGQQFPKEFLANPALDLLLMLNPALMEEVPEALLVRLLKQTDCPDDFLIWAAGHESEKVQLAVAMNAKAPEQAKDKLLQSHYAKVRESLPQIEEEISAAVAEAMFLEEVRKRLAALSSGEALGAWSRQGIGLPQWPCLSAEARLTVEGFKFHEIEELVKQSPNILTDLSQSNDEELRKIAARASVATPTVLEILSKDEVRKVRCATASNPNTPPHVLASMANDKDEEVRSQVGKNPATPLDALQKLANDISDEVRSCVAENQSCTPTILEKLARDKNEMVRNHVAMNMSTPRDIIIELSQDRSVYVRCGLAWNPISPSALLETLARDRNEDVQENLIYNENITREVQEILANSKSKYIRSQLANNDKTLGSVLNFLAADKDADVRCNVAKNPRSPIPTLELLSRDKNHVIRFTVSDHPNCPPEILEKLFEKEAFFVEEYIASNPSISLSLMWKISQSESKRSRGYLARNPAVDVEVLKILARDKSSDVRSSVAGNIAAPPELLELLANDKSENVRLSVSVNTGCPASVIKVLASDKSSAVRGAVAQNPKTPCDTLVFLSVDEDEFVRQRVACNPNVPQEVLLSLSLENDASLRINLLKNPNFPQENRELSLLSLLVRDPRLDMWFIDQLRKESDEIKQAVATNEFWRYPGKNLEKSAKNTKTIDGLLAICSDINLDPAITAMASVSTDWLVRAAVAKNSVSPMNIIQKLSNDAHPVVARLANNRLKSLIVSSSGAS